MKKVKCKESVIRQQCIENEGAEYRYMLIVKESESVTSYRMPLYSIQIEMVDNLGGHTEARASDIFSDVGKAIVFYDRMVRNLATPIDLPYIIEDEIR